MNIFDMIKVFVSHYDYSSLTTIASIIALIILVAIVFIHFFTRKLRIENAKKGKVWNWSPHKYK